MNASVEAFALSKVAALATRARAAARLLATLKAARRNEALLAAAAAIEEKSALILSANDLDCQAAARAVERGEMSRAMFERLQTSERGIRQMAAGIREVAALDDPLGRELAVTLLDDGLTLYKLTCPLGVVGVIFESRPDVISQVAALALKSGNALLLKGGAEAAHTHETLINIWHEALAGFADVPADALNLLHTREDVLEMLKRDDEIDLIIPRGSKEFVRYVAEQSRIPVLGHGEGICHVYVDRAADLQRAQAIALDSKTQYPSACNSAETLLVHEEVAAAFLSLMIEHFRRDGVEVRGCPRTLALSHDVVQATEEDWATEYSDLIISIKIVGSCDEAIEHIHAYGSGHTESIVTEDRDAASLFMERIDAAGVYHNASTRFADGFRYGFGAELGISTGKLHARGPVGLEGLTTYKYRLVGDGHIVASYSSGERSFKHRRIRAER
ncbi:MAG TPA: glutamate-5-semialdehyde dehydrogenase [Pyrinomonadaceae bacterium]|jgi:glutamate-5-semialdehyde dehydrogenase|nr:glutamate-5-semialdehyde dehydrogenase [Pyrinomonadaceae bacterium]